MKAHICTGFYMLADGPMPCARCRTSDWKREKRAWQFQHLQPRHRKKKAA